MKKSKKFVLAALALLAITGLLALAGCKTEVDTNQFTSAGGAQGHRGGRDSPYIRSACV